MIASSGATGIIGLTIGWLITLACAVLTVLLFMGKGSRFVGGFKNMNDVDKRRYDQSVISKNAGKLLMLFALGLAVYMSILTFTWSRSMVLYASMGLFIYLLAVFVVSVKNGFKRSPKEPD